MKFWGFPGGVVDVDETPAMAALRETAEEVGIDVEIEYQVGTYLLTGGGWPDILASVYKGHIVKGTPHANGTEISTIMWCRVDALPSPLLPDAEAAFEDFVQGEKEVIRPYRRTRVMPEWHDD
jgi:8-oxo-dGTP pyrophosphatase MutT (NUDIX family)